MGAKLLNWSKWVILPLALFGGGSDCAGYANLKPEIRLATLAQLRAIVPKELLVPVPVDKVAQDRFKAFIMLARSLDQADADKLVTNWIRLAQVYEGRSNMGKVTIADQQATVGSIWAKHPGLLSDLSIIVQSGAIRFPEMVSADPDDYLAECNLFRLLAFSAESYAAFGDFNLAAKMIEVSYRLGDRMLESPGGLASYDNAILISGLTTAATPVLSMPNLPAENCAEILKAMKPAPKQDEFAVRAIQIEFVRYTLPDLAEDKHLETGADSYDAFETAKAESKAALMAISNLRTPYSRANNAYFKQLLQDANDILKRVLLQEYSGPYKAFEVSTVCNQVYRQFDRSNLQSVESAKLRLILNRIHNSLGRLQLGQIPYELLQTISSRWRLDRDLTRILLASRIYRASHTGKLPQSTAEFVPILGEWPTNPYDGKPLTYLPKQEKISGAGPDLIDHGRDNTASFSTSWNPEISLKLTKY